MTARSGCVRSMRRQRPAVWVTSWCFENFAGPWRLDVLPGERRSRAEGPVELVRELTLVRAPTQPSLPCQRR